MLISINEGGLFNVNVYIDMKTEFKIVVYFINLLLYFYLFITFPVKFVFIYPIIFIIYIYLLRRKWRTPLSGNYLCVCNGYK